MKKNEIYITEVVDNGMDLEGICKIDNIPVFVPGLVRGEVVKIKIVKVNKSYAFGKVEEIIEKSPYRVSPPCKSYSKCGGCEGLHIDYTKLLDIKRNNAINTLKKQNIAFDFSNASIYGMGNPYNYRNKAQYPVREKNGKLDIGMFSKRTHNLVDANACQIQDVRINEIVQIIHEVLTDAGFSGYNEEMNTGDIRNILVRRGFYTNEIMLVFVVNSIKLVKDKRWEKIVEKICEKIEDITSICLNVNSEKTNVILTDNTVCIYGKDYITDYIGEFKFKIGANSFFQVNTLQAETLYNVLKDNLKLNGNEKLLDLYSGVGSIGIFLSKCVSQVYGVEIVKQAVEMAKDNIKINNISNVKYIAGDATEEIAKLKSQGVEFDVVVVDPPRKGLDGAGIDTLKEIKAPKIGYVSCNVSTLARDLKLLADTYDVKFINFVDMFPFTSHVECVAVLCLKGSIQYK